MGMRADWVRTKDGLKKQVADVKKNGGHNPKQIEDALKSFDSGFGPLLDKMEAAYKANKGDDVRKCAGQAEVIGQQYLTKLEGISNSRGTGAAMALKALLHRLGEAKENGMTANALYFE